jgi:hypothetical protein
MAINYLTLIDKSRKNEPEHAASAPVFYESSKRRLTARNVSKPARLTRKPKRALLKGAQSRSRRRRSKSSSETSTTMAKRRLSKKARAAALKNLAKARRARKAKAAPKAHRRSRKSRKAARRSRKAARRSRKRKARAAEEWRGEPKRHAKAARKGWRKRRHGRRRKAKAVHSRRVSSKRSRAAKRGWAKRRRAHKAPAKKRSRKASRRRARLAPAYYRRKSKTARRLEHAEMYATERRRGRRHSRRRSGYRRNPMGAAELLVGGLSGLVGFGLGDFTDRLLATHAITVKAAATATTPATYADTPPTTGSYQGLFNPTAITAPMNLVRWANALGAPAALFVVANFVKGPKLKSSLHLAAFGYGLRTVGKGLIDLVAKFTTSFQLGQQLYDGEMRAQVLQANNGNQTAAALGNLPAAGLGKPGDCVGCNKQLGVGWPSMPRETGTPANAAAPAPQQLQPQPAALPARPAPPPPAASLPGAPPGASTQGLTGAKKSNGAAWGEYEH